MSNIAESPWALTSQFLRGSGVVVEPEARGIRRFNAALECSAYDDKLVLYRWVDGDPPLDFFLTFYRQEDEQGVHINMDARVIPPTIILTDELLRRETLLPYGRLGLRSFEDIKKVALFNSVSLACNPGEAQDPARIKKVIWNFETGLLRSGRNHITYSGPIKDLALPPAKFIKL